MNTFERDKEYVAATYKRFPVEIVSGKGSLYFDADGKEYIDLGSGIGVNAFGVGDEEYKKAVTEQLDKVQHTSNLYYTSPCTRLAELICEKTGMKRVFFGNSGAEANECAIKVARKYAAEKKGKNCSTILTLVNSFHGRTLTTLAATGQDKFHELFQPLTPGFAHVPAGDFEAFVQACEKYDPAGFLMECVQGEGGVVPVDADYIRATRDYCDKHDIVFMLDEVQTGNGRTGKLYSYMHFGITPDVFTTAKGLAGGLPIGACVLGDKVKDVFGPGDHGSTFGGNPIACAAALSILSRIDDTLLDDVQAKSRLVYETLEGKPGIESITGLGLMLGIKTARPAGEVVAACIERGALPLTAKDKVRLLPPLNIPRELLEKGCKIIAECAG